MPDLPDWFEPMAATLTQERFAGPQWTFERKYDGIRLIARKDTTVQLYSRTHRPQALPTIAAAVAALTPRELILDGELTWDGRRYHVFDVLWIDGRDLRSLPLEERRAELAALKLAPPLEHVETLHDPEPWLRAANEGWEGVIAKRRGSPYESRRSPHWLKMKVEANQELVVGGFTEPRGQRQGLGALLVGHYEGVDLVFAGKVGTGFDTKLLLELRARFDALEITRSPFVRGDPPKAGVHWVRPEVVVQVAFMEWTGHGKLRHPRFIGVRDDVLARNVTREVP